MDEEMRVGLGEVVSAYLDMSTQPKVDADVHAKNDVIDVVLTQTWRLRRGDADFHHLASLNK